MRINIILVSLFIHLKSFKIFRSLSYYYQFHFFQSWIIIDERPIKVVIKNLLLIINIDITVNWFIVIIIVNFLV